MPIKVQGGKTYVQVAERLAMFEEYYPKHRIRTSVDFMDGKQVIMRAEILRIDGCAVSTGHAHAHFGGDKFTDKLVEKCETCAVGRALAFLDTRLRGDEIASADELAVAIQGESVPLMTEEHAHAIFKLLDDVDLDSGDGVSAFAEAWLECDQDQQMAISPFLKSYYPGDITKTKELMRNTMRNYRLNKERISAV